MNVVVYGGAFDPLHNGHVDIIHYVLSLNRHDRLCLVPTGIPVYKDRMFFSADARCKMLQVMFGDDPMIDILDVEIQKAQPSYTIDTLSFLFGQYGATSVTLVVGFDQLFQFHRWRQFDKILSQCQLLVIPRDGIDHEKLMQAFPEELVPYQDVIHYHDVLPTNISSSRIRMMLQRDESIDDVVPDKIIPIIREYGGDESAWH